MANTEGRRVKVFCVTCSFAPDDLFFPVIVTASIKGTWLFFSFAVCIALFARPGCDGSIPSALAVSVAGFTFLQLLAFAHKLVLLVFSTRGTIREPKHGYMRELVLIGASIYIAEIVWACYSTVAVFVGETTSKLDCEEFRKPFTAYVVLVWLSWLELALLALVYFSCLDRCKCFCCRAVCVVHSRCTSCDKTASTEQVVLSGKDQPDVGAMIKVTPTSHSLSTSHLCSLFREKCFTCRRNGLNNSKNVALQDLSEGLEVLYRDIEIHYTALDRLAGLILVQKYHSQMLKQGNDSIVTRELLEGTLRFLKKKGVVQKSHVVREPQPLVEGSRLPETLLYYYWFAMAAFGWTVKVFLEPFSGICQLCWGARCCGCRRGGGVRKEGIEEEKGMLFRSAEVASIAGIDVSDIILGKSSNDVHCPLFYVCRTVRQDTVTREEVKEVIITIRGTLSVKDVMTNFTASMRDATKCQESLVENWFQLLVKTKLTFLGVEDAYFHTGFYKSAKVILNMLRKSTLFRDLVEKQNYRVVVTGHSLGAGVGAVLTLLIKHKHPHWSEGLHAYLYSIPGCVCNYRLAEKAEELGIITSVVGVHDMVPRISWRALTYLKLLVKKALNETSIKKQEVLCCGNLPSWNPSIFGGSTHPVGLIDEQSGAATPDFLELQEALPTVRRGTWDICHIDRGKKREEKGVVRVEGDEDVEYQERRRTNVGDELEEVRERLKEHKESHTPEAEAKMRTIGPIMLAPVEDHSKKKKDDERLERVATEFTEEKSRLGPLMFIPGRVLHIEEMERVKGKGVGRWCGLGVLGLRCCGIRYMEDRLVRASWKAREDMTGIILHRDCIVDHSPRRLLALLTSLTHTHQTNVCTPQPQAADDQHTELKSTTIDMESNHGTEQHGLEHESAADIAKPSVVMSDSTGSEGYENPTALASHQQIHTVSVEIHKQS